MSSVHDGRLACHVPGASRAAPNRLCDPDDLLWAWHRALFHAAGLGGARGGVLGVEGPPRHAGGCTSCSRLPSHQRHGGGPGDGGRLLSLIPCPLGRLRGCSRPKGAGTCQGNGQQGTSGPPELSPARRSLGRPSAPTAPTPAESFRGPGSLPHVSPLGSGRWHLISAPLCGSSLMDFAVTTWHPLQAEDCGARGGPLRPSPRGPTPHCRGWGLSLWAPPPQAGGDRQPIPHDLHTWILPLSSCHSLGPRLGWTG